MSSTAPADFWDNFHAERPGEANPAPIRPRDEQRAHSPPRRRRPMRRLFRFLLAVGIGVGSTLAWQAFGDMAREMAAAAYPQQLGWLIPPTTSTGSVAAAAPAPAAAATVGSAAPVATPDQQQLAAMSLNLADVRQSIDALAAQLASSQQQVTGDIARLRASEQDILAKLSAPPPRPVPAHKPAPLALRPAAPPAAEQ